MSCKIFRNSEGKVERVIAPNGQDSKLYQDILNLPEVQGDQDLAVDLFLTAYTPSFKGYFGDFELGEQKGLVDQNNEPFVSSILNFLKPPPAISKFVRKPKQEEKSIVQIKPGVSELFESNPELANQVYEALGFKSFDNKGVSLDTKERDGWKWIKLNGKNIGEVKLVKNDRQSKEVGLSIKLNEEYQNKGYGQIVHTLVADWAKNEFGDTLYSDFDNSQAEINTLLALTKKGYAEKIGDYGVKEDGRYNTDVRAFRIKTSDEIGTITPQQKQQAQQLYSQYLDTVFPDSQVKDIVYHGGPTEIKDKFKDSFTEDGAFYKGIFFSNSINYIKQLGEKYKKNVSKITSAIINSTDNFKVKEPLSYEQGQYWYFEQYDSVQGKDAGQEVEGDVFAVRTPEQIHILGNKEDIEGFKNFIETAPKFQKEAPTTVPIVRSIANVKKVLDRLKEKFGVEYEIVYEPDADWKGKYQNGKVYINGSKNITKDTAFHEYLHPFMLALKKDNRPLYDRLINQLQSVEEGRMEIEGVSKSEGYEDLSEEEKLDEALVSYVAKLASGNITEQGDIVESEVERARQSILGVVKAWFKKLFQKLFGIRVSDLELTYNLQDIADFVSLNDIKVDVAGLPVSSTPLYQLDEQTREFKKFVLRKSNDLQKKIVEDLLFEPKPGEQYAGKVILEPENHVYIHTKTGQTYKSVTTAIKGVLEDPENLYELNRLFGNEFDKTLQSIIEGKTFEEAKGAMTGILSEEMSKSAYNALKGIFVGLTADGSIILPQIILADPDSGIAGSLDIFIVSPEGKVKILDLKVSKNSFKSDKYKNAKYDVKKESVFEGRKFTTQEQHGMQVSAYKRLAEINGYQVDEVATIHILLDVEGKGAEQKIKSFEVEGIQDHPPTLYEKDLNKMIKTKSNRNKVNGFKKELGLHNPANDSEFLDENEELPEQDVSPELMEQLGFTINKYVEKLRQRQEYLKNLNKGRFSTFSDVSKEESIDRISELLSSIEDSMIGRKPSEAFTKLLNYTKETLDNVYRYINDPANVSKPEYIDVILEAEKYVESYREIASIPELGLGSEAQYKLMRAVQSRLNAVKEEINPALESYVKDLIKKKTNASSLSEEELNNLLKEGYDISLDQLQLSDMQNTKERLLAIAANLYTEANQKAMNRADDFIKKITDAGNALARALGMKKIDFSFMLNYDKDGKFTGRYLEPIGQKYYELKRKMYSLIKNDKGENLEYIFIPDITKAKPEDVLFNIDLRRKKEKLTEFLQAERLVDGKIESGEYHRYTSEFLNERAKYEQPDMDALDYGILKWKKKTGVSDSAYRKFRDKYYDRTEEYVGVKFETDGSYKGKTEVKPPTYFPKKQYVETKEISSKGEDMRDSRYAKLMNPKTAVEQAQKDFYLLFVQEMKETLEKLPIDVQQKMIGKVARVKDNYINAAKKKGGNTFTAIVKNIREWFDFSPKLHTIQKLTDDDGYPTDSLPILYTNNARNEKAIESLKEKIKELKDEYIVKKSISTEAYEEKLKKLEMSLAIENSKIEFDDINIDMVENIIAFRKMAEKYEQMSNIESSLLALSKIVEKKKYYETNSLGEKFQRKGKEKKDIYKKEGASLAHQRFKKWFKMVYYNNDEYDYSTFAVVADKIQNITSVKGMGLNIFGSVNNYIMGRINNAIEAYGGVYFQRKAYFRATKEFNREYMPGLMKKIGSSTDDVYKIKKPKSKYEAMVDYFRMVRKFQSDGGRVDALSALYIFQESGEYNVQSKTGVAITMSDKFMLTNSKTGEQVAIYDAFDFNENTGELTLKNGYEVSEDFKTKVTNYIYEVNKQIHGNYAWEDRMVIQQHALGELGAQFHKWVYPLFRARFQKRYDNEVLGSIEGRYRTFWNVMKYVYQTEQGVLGKLGGMLKATFLPGSVKGLDELQVRNMYKNMAEMSFLLASFLMAHLFKLLASGLDDDDEQVKKLVNFMIFQQTRQVNEIKTFIPILGIKEQYQMAKSPIAALTTMRDYGEAAASVLTMPFPPYDKNYYERGPHKGGLKAVKELGDIIPAFNVLNRWESFETVRSFYIR